MMDERRNRGSHAGATIKYNLSEGFNFFNQNDITAI